MGRVGGKNPVRFRWRWRRRICLVWTTLLTLCIPFHTLQAQTNNTLVHLAVGKKTRFFAHNRRPIDDRVDKHNHYWGLADTDPFWGLVPWATSTQHRQRYQIEHTRAHTRRTFTLEDTRRRREHQLKLFLFVGKGNACTTVRDEGSL